MPAEYRKEFDYISRDYMIVFAFKEGAYATFFLLWGMLFLLGGVLLVAAPLTDLDVRLLGIVTWSFGITYLLQTISKVFSISLCS